MAASRKLAAVAAIATLAFSSAALVPSAIPRADAQATGDVDISGGTGNVSVVYAPGGVEPPLAGPGTSTPPAATEWPYTCTFYVGGDLETLANSTTSPTAGNYYNLVCNPKPGSGATLFAEPAYLYDPAGPLIPGEPDLVTSLEVREVAANALDPTDLGVGTSPDTQQITGIETWLWPEGSTENTSVSASAGPLTVTVESRFVQTEFTMTGANNDTITCTTAEVWEPGKSSSPCTTTFFEQDAAQRIEARTTWQLFWRDNAAQPTFTELGSITETQVEIVDVVDLEAVIVRN